MDSGNAYIYGLSGTPIEEVNLSTGAATYLMADQLGSVRGIVSSAGSLLATTSYDAWGNPQTPGGLTSYTPFGYAGYYTDPTGLLYLINRYYEPLTGQFLSVDPAVAQTLAPYDYADGDPVTGKDPTGLNSGPGGGGGGYPPDSKYYVYFAWHDREHHIVPLRQGNSKWGWKHASKNHVTPDVIGETIRRGDRVKFEGGRHNEGNKWNYAIKVRNRTLWEYEHVEQTAIIVVGALLGKDLDDDMPQGVTTGSVNSTLMETSRTARLSSRIITGSSSSQ